MKFRDTLFIGFTLFALFFGAGNLIYPVSLGMEAGSSYFLAIAGFVTHRCRDSCDHCRRYFLCSKWSN